MISTRSAVDWRGVEQCFNARQDGCERNACDRHIEASGTIPQQTAQCAGQPKRRFTTQRRSKTTKPFRPGSR